MVPARIGKLHDNVNDLFSFSDKKDLSAFLKFVEDGVMAETTLQTVTALSAFCTFI